MPTYSFSDVLVSIVGPGITTSIGAGNGVASEGIAIAMAATHTMTIGLDGEGVHMLNPDKSGTVTISLLQTSPKNAILQAAYDAQSASSALWGKNLIVVTMAGVGDVHSCRSCAFAGKPSVSYGQDGHTVAWKFNALKIDSILGTYSE